MSNTPKEKNDNPTLSNHANHPQISDHLTDDQKIDLVAAYILKKYHSAFEQLAKH